MRADWCTRSVERRASEFEGNSMGLRLKREPGETTVLVVPPSSVPTRIVARCVQQNSHTVWEAPIHVNVTRGEIEVHSYRPPQDPGLVVTTKSGRRLCVRYVENGIVYSDIIFDGHIVGETITSVQAFIDWVESVETETTGAK